MTESRDDPLTDHPPADKYVYRELRRADEPLTRLEVEEQTYLRERTVNRALRRLAENGHVEEIASIGKPRYCVARQNGERREE